MPPTNIPTRTEIQAKIDEIKKDKSYSTIREDMYQRIEDWLDSLDLPPTVTIFQEQLDPQQMIMEDLHTYTF